MSRRVSLPGADELFRTTGDGIDADRSERGNGTSPSSQTAPTERRDPGGVGSHPGDGSGGQGLQEHRWPGDGPESDALEPLRAAVDAATRDARAPGGSFDDASSPAGSSTASTEHGERSSGSRRSAVRRRPRATGERRPTGRERHEEKITVYVSAEELLDLEHARLGLRGDHGLAVDRGRIVREALAVVIADFEAKGENSILVRRLTGR